MNDEARGRLAEELRRSAYSGAAICRRNGWPPTYISRVIKGEIQKIPADRLLDICETIDADIVFILSGKRIFDESDDGEFLKNIVSAPSSTLQRLRRFAEDQKLFSPHDDSMNREKP